MEVILPDVNVLVDAAQVDAREHARYAEWLHHARSVEGLALPETVLIGFIRVVSDPRIFERPMGTADAIAFVDALRAAPRSVEITAGGGSWRRLRTLTAHDQGVRGRLVPDAWLAALAISHGVRLATNDRGFGRFPGLDWFVPVAPAG